MWSPSVARTGARLSAAVGSTERQVLFDIFDVSVRDETCAPESTLALGILLLKNVALALFAT